MEPTSPPPAAPRRPLALPVLVLVLLAFVGGWWTLRARGSHDMEEALAPWAGTPLPAPDAPVEGALADLGAQVFDTKCAACHALRGEPRLGPNLEGVTQRRTYGWIQAMILAPDSMTRDDPLARTLRQGYGVQMLVAGGMDTLRTRAVLEFLRRVDAGPQGS